MIYCKFCELDKEESDFYTKSARCKSCHREYNKKHYTDNKQYYVDKARRNTGASLRKIYTFLLEYFTEHPCLDCGETDPRVLEFDHINPAKKLANVSDLIHSGKSLKIIQEEIAKCQVLCANCHRRKTAIQFGWLKDLMPQ